MAKVRGFPPVAPSRIEMASCLCGSQCKTFVLALQKQMPLNHLSGQGIHFTINPCGQTQDRGHIGPEAYLCLWEFQGRGFLGCILEEEGCRFQLDKPLSPGIASLHSKEGGSRWLEQGLPKQDISNSYVHMNDPGHLLKCRIKTHQDGRWYSAHLTSSPVLLIHGPHFVSKAVACRSAGR